MKKTTYLFAFLLSMFFLSAHAQKVVQASEIIEKLDRGEPVLIKDATISGVLDLTDLQNRSLEKESDDWFNSSKTYRSQVQQELRFENCTFEDDVLAYYHLEDEKSTYVADFKGDVLFKDCDFRGKSEFKYSDFKEEAIFAKTRFNEEANFKYARFNETPDFSAVSFEEGANFKYTDFSEGASFQSAVFDDEANFKYAKFPEGVDFTNTLFKGMANFKYTKFSEPLRIAGIQFSGSTDFKYTAVDGEDFTAYLIRNR